MERLTEDSVTGETYIKQCASSCPYDGEYCGTDECPVLNKAADKLGEYERAEEQGLLVRLPCKVGDIVYIDSEALPIEGMECHEDTNNKIPLYFQGRVVSFRFAQRNWVKIAVKAKWLHEWIDDEAWPESDCIEREKTFSILLSMIGKNIFLTREEAENKLEEMKK